MKTARRRAAAPKLAGETAGAGKAAAGHGAKGFNGTRNKTRHGFARWHKEAAGLWNREGKQGMALRVGIWEPQVSGATEKTGGL